MHDGARLWWMNRRITTVSVMKGSAAQRSAAHHSMLMRSRSRCRHELGDQQRDHDAESWRLLHRCSCSSKGRPSIGSSGGRGQRAARGSCSSPTCRRATVACLGCCSASLAAKKCGPLSRVAIDGRNPGTNDRPPEPDDFREHSARAGHSASLSSAGVSA